MSTENKIKDVSRRDFLQKTTAAAIGSFFIVPRHVLGKGFKAPSDKLNIAGIGIGGKGFSDITNAYNKGAENVVALCDVDWNLGQKCFDKFPDAKKYKDFRKMFDEMGKDIDAVTISTPDHTHAVIAMAAMARGKHVYVQKPLTHNINEARVLTEAARKYKLVSQMGNQGASNPGQQQMVEWFKKGVIGTVKEVDVWTNRPIWPQGIPVPTQKSEVPSTLDWDLYVGPAEWVDYSPAYHPFKWHGWWNFGTGALGDMGCHLIDSPFRVLGLGYPTEVECSVGAVFLKDWTPEYIPEGCPPSSRVEIKFPATKVNKSPLTMTWHDGGLRPFHPDLVPANDPLGDADSSNGAMLIGDKGVMMCGTYGNKPKVYLKGGEKLEMPANAFQTKYTSLPEFGHHVAWTDACKAGFASKEHKALSSSFDYSGPLTETVIMGNLAIRSYNLRKENADGKGFNYPGRKRLLWDGNSMKITNFDEANQFVTRKYRGDWKLS
ncbi:Gfo/Idh/MocA family protein [Dyadobacter sp. CY312]|uniref:Gfo/Idh/MocA family protein n=1 Tax=Dyadobacter sp. CY312 TaxID=2907303 RepID=UPI001F2F6D09|nr:Gfo/Idh/MocA family oxidoreductase [Dyadobacter sp. CY312]MCE7041234.1 Gfo/Idh/MocA family oxidoreductase [Dyadobacter sp. CY312]